MKQKYGHPWWDGLQIVASNDINESALIALGKEEHCITAYGIGTNLVTCQEQPALGCVYKLVEVAGKPRIKISQEISKILIPGRKESYRLYGSDGKPLIDLMVAEEEGAPKVGERILCRHPFEEQKRAFVTPKRVEKLSDVWWDGKAGLVKSYPTIGDGRRKLKQQISSMRNDHLRNHSPTPYKVSVSEKLFEFLHRLWLEEAPVRELT